MNLKDYIETIENFPKDGITFRDVNTLLGDSKALKYSIDKITDYAKKQGATKIVGPEARGFLFGMPVAYNTSTPFIPVRKPGKLPRKTIEISYDLEYGSNTLCIHADSVTEGDKIVIVDDLLATGGTIAATIKLIEQLGGSVVGLAFIIELDELSGRSKFEGYDVYSLVHY
ncbi:MAG: adenine phosphoribosyltransferase [Bacilli bacterium]